MASSSSSSSKQSSDETGYTTTSIPKTYQSILFTSVNSMDNQRTSNAKQFEKSSQSSTFQRLQEFSSDYSQPEILPKLPTTSTLSDMRGGRIASQACSKRVPSTQSSAKDHASKSSGDYSAPFDDTIPTTVCENTSKVFASDDGFTGANPNGFGQFLSSEVCQERSQNPFSETVRKKFFTSSSIVERRTE
jgi:hypothetical protein